VQKTAKRRVGKQKKTVGKNGRSPDNKTTQMIELLKRPDGATLQELTSASGWQSHSVRGFLSAALGKRMGLKVNSKKGDDGQRVYRIA